MSTAANWDTLPVAEDTIRFLGGTQTTVSVDNSFNVDLRRVEFNNNGGSGQTAGFTLNGPNTLIGANINSTAYSGGTVTDTINADYNQRFTNNACEIDTNRTLIMNGVYSGDVSSGAWSKTGAGTLIMNNNANTISKNTTVGAGTLQINGNWGADNRNTTGNTIVLTGFSAVNVPAPSTMTLFLFGGWLVYLKRRKMSRAMR